MDSPNSAARDEDVEGVLAGSRALLGISARSLRDALDLVSLQQYRVLVLVWSRGPVRSGALAEAVGVHPSTSTRAVDRLVAGGWVERRENPDTRREVLVAVTPAGRALVERVAERRRAEVVTVLGELAPDRRGAVASALRTFAEAAGEVDARDLARLGHES